jgi:hypothetical protein
VSATTEKEKGVAGSKRKEIKSLSLLFLSRLSLLINKGFDLCLALVYFSFPLFRENVTRSLFTPREYNCHAKN